MFLFVFFGIVGIFRCVFSLSRVFSFVDPAGAYVNTLRPQRRPGSAGRARSDDKNKSGNKSGGAKKLQRPTTAPGRRREDQQVAHGMSGQMVDAASEEVSGPCCRPLWKLRLFVVETCCCRLVRSWSQSFSCSYPYLFLSLSRWNTTDN
jgi:hypothetical protein